MCTVSGMFGPCEMVHRLMDPDGPGTFFSRDPQLPIPISAQRLTYPVNNPMFIAHQIINQFVPSGLPTTQLNRRVRET
jgi:hypothetical protein